MQRKGEDVYGRTRTRRNRTEESPRMNIGKKGRRMTTGKKISVQGAEGEKVNGSQCSRLQEDRRKAGDRT